MMESAYLFNWEASCSMCCCGTMIADIQSRDGETFSSPQSYDYCYY